MYLTVSLLRKGFTVHSQNRGPDIQLEIDGRRIWIEAVCATAGEIGRPDSVPKTAIEQVAAVPVREYTLRILASLQEKAGKFRTYIDKKIVRANDTLAIAINIYEIDGIMPGIDNVIMRALYGRGNPVALIDKYTGELKSVDHQGVMEVVKHSGSAVGTMPFIDGSMAHVSSALVFSNNAANPPKSLGDDCILYPNLSSQSLWHRGAIPMGCEWSFTECEDRWKGSRIDYLNG